MMYANVNVCVLPAPNPVAVHMLFVTNAAAGAGGTAPSMYTSYPATGNPSNAGHDTHRRDGLRADTNGGSGRGSGCPDAYRWARMSKLLWPTKLAHATRKRLAPSE